MHVESFRAIRKLILQKSFSGLQNLEERQMTCHLLRKSSKHRLEQKLLSLFDQRNTKRCDKLNSQALRYSRQSRLVSKALLKRSTALGSARLNVVEVLIEPSYLASPQSPSSLGCVHCESEYRRGLLTNPRFNSDLVSRRDLIM